jgi:hypothetical protein
MLVLPIKSKVVWKRFMEENRPLIYKFVLKEIKKNLTSSAEKIDLFKCEDGSRYTWIQKKEIPVVLNEAVNVFIKTEEYEYAKKADDLLKQYYIHKLLSEI